MCSVLCQALRMHRTSAWKSNRCKQFVIENSCHVHSKPIQSDPGCDAKSRSASKLTWQASFWLKKCVILKRGTVTEKCPLHKISIKSAQTAINQSKPIIFTFENREFMVRSHTYSIIKKPKDKMVNSIGFALQTIKIS